MKTEIVKGFKDFTGKEALKREKIREVLVRTFSNYGFEPAETPVIEYEDFVKGDKEQEKDEAISDTYKLKDKGNRKLALRYEFTFQLKRIMKNKKIPYKRFQIGPVFRDEPIKGNRLRQFIQCDVDTLGASIKDEAEILAVVKKILDQLKIKAIIYVNNRNLLEEILDKERVKKKNEVIRELDKLDKLSEKEVLKNLKKYNAENVLNIFKKDKKFFEKYDSFKEIKDLEEFCKLYGVEIEFLPSLARGLSYYKGNVFEVKTEKMRETIFGGGNYVFNNVRGFGFGASIERLAMVSEKEFDFEKYLVVSLNRDKEAVNVAEKLRKKGKNVSLFYGKPSKALEYANSYFYDKVVFVGEKEVKSKMFKIKNMKTGKESLLR